MSAKIIVIGDKGFVGSNIVKRLLLSDKEVVGINRSDVDLLNQNSQPYIQGKISDGDTVVISAAIAPAKNSNDLEQNITLITNVIKAIKDKTLEYVLNISSDAVYDDSSKPISEKTTIYPQGFHGTMHCIREYLLEKNLICPIGHLRPTLIFGDNDPHNGYGPNSFYRKALKSDDIQLFGNGEELRDHVHIDDVAKISMEMIIKKIEGSLNAVTGEVYSFNDIASLTKKFINSNISILNNPRNGPMPHNGYRAFDNSKLKQIMPSIQMTSLDDYFKSKMD